VQRDPTDTADHAIVERFDQLRLFRDDEDGDGAHNEHAAGVPEGYASSTGPLTGSRLLRSRHVLRVERGSPPCRTLVVVDPCRH